MRITALKYTLKIGSESKPSLGKYESEELSCEGILTESDNKHEAVSSLMAFVRGSLGLDRVDPSNEKVVVEHQEIPPVIPSKTEEKTLGAKRSVQKSKPSKEEDKTPSKPKSSPKPKHVEYSRESDELKAKFVEVINQIAPDWRATNSSKEAVKKVSERSVGLPLLDEKGNILQTFRDKVAEYYSEETKTDV